MSNIGIKMMKSNGIPYHKIDMLTCFLMFALIVGTAIFSFYSGNDILYIAWKVDEFNLEQINNTVTDSTFFANNQYYSIHGFNNNSVMALSIPNNINTNENFTIKYIIGTNKKRAIEINLFIDDILIKDTTVIQYSTTVYNERISLTTPGRRNVSISIRDRGNTHTIRSHDKNRTLQIQYYIFVEDG